MHARDEVVRFAVYLGVAIAVSVVLATVWAFTRDEPFRDALGGGCYLLGAVAVVLAGLGGSPSRRDASSASWRDRWAYADTFTVNRDNPPTNPAGLVVLCVGVGIVLFVLGWAIS